MLRLLMQQDKTVFYQARKAKALYAFVSRAHDGGANRWQHWLRGVEVDGRCIGL